MLLAAGSGDPQLIAKLGPAASRDWNGFLLAAAQITSAGGLLGFGVVLSWMFGREFGDGTITGLFALPVRRSTIALAKLLVYGAWAAAMSLCLGILLLLVGLIAGLGPQDAGTWMALLRQVALGILTAAIAIPAAWAATLGRSVLAGVSVAIGLVVIAQVSVLAGAGGWMPLASPALWAMSAGAGGLSGSTRAGPAVPGGFRPRHVDDLAADAAGPIETVVSAGEVRRSRGWSSFCNAGASSLSRAGDTLKEWTSQLDSRRRSPSSAAPASTSSSTRKSRTSSRSGPHMVRCVLLAAGSATGNWCSCPGTARITLYLRT